MSCHLNNAGLNMYIKRGISVLLFVVAQLWAVAAWADGYRVGVNDTLSIQIAVWDAANATVIDMYGVSGSYPVGADGEISVALAGPLIVADMTTIQVARTLEAAMTPYAGIGQAPHVAVSVERYAPIYVAGAVEQPGLYDYAPGLIVQMAVTLAGGPAAVKPIEGEERNFLSARGTINVLQNELMFLTARRDRLMAEINGNTGLSEHNTDLDPAAWAAEAAILQAREARYEHELTSLVRARASLEEALNVLENKLVTNRAQLEAGQAELLREQDLVDRGLAASSRIFDRTSYVSELESRLLDIERSILLARQELQEHERNEGLLVALRVEENTTDVQVVNADIAEVEAQLASQYDLMSAAAGQQIGQLSAVDPTTATAVYSITRARGDDATPFMGDPSTPLIPGDLVEVQFEASIIASPSN